MTLTIEKIVSTNAHIWNLRKESNPKTRAHWLDATQNMIVFNPESIKSQLETAKKRIADAKNAKKEILVICETPLYNNEIAELSSAFGFHYFNHKIPSGVLTNFDTLIGRIKAMNELSQFVAWESFSTLTKKEQSHTNRKLRKIEDVYKGVKNLKKSPDLVIIIDWKSMVKFVDEVIKLKKDAIVIASSNFDRWIDEDSLIVSNVYSHKSLDFVAKYLFTA